MRPIGPTKPVKVAENETDLMRLIEQKIADQEAAKKAAEDTQKGKGK